MKYFGTDGIRGKFGEFPVTLDVVSRVILALRICSESPSLKIVIGRDPRESGRIIEKTLLDNSIAADGIFLCGVVPSPAVPMAVLVEDADFGIMITASHNQFDDNGIKFFDKTGKVSVEFEERLEKCIESCQRNAQGGKANIIIDISKKVSKLFLESMASRINAHGEIKKITVDAANGSLSSFVKKCYKNVCGKVIVIGDDLTKKINHRVGSEYPEVISAAVLANGSDLGISHDGDGDRVVICDENGIVIDGEKIFALISDYFMKSKKMSQNRTIVTTVMSNMGLDVALRNLGVVVERTAVGDRNVARRMLEIGSNFGGECSGHMLFNDLESTSNGVLSAIMVINAMSFLGIKASDVQKLVKMYPQKKCSLGVKKIIPIEEIPFLAGELKNISDYLSKFNGRLVIRYSGTEPKLRILVESESDDVSNECLIMAKNIIANSPIMH